MTGNEAHVLVQPDGRALSFADIGRADAEPILFCHSLPGARLMPAFASAILDKYGFRMITPDRPGFGFSDFVPGRKITDSARDIGLVADHLGLDRFRVLGVSAGSPYVLACCIEFPDRIEAAGIVSGVTMADEAGILHQAVPAPLHSAARRSRRVSSLLHGLLLVGMRKAPDKAIEGLAKTLSPSDQRVMAQPEAAAYVVDISREAGRNGARGWVYDDWLLNQPWDFSPADVPASVPLKLWWGADDSSTPVVSAEALVREIPHADLRVIPDCGHFGVMFDHLDIVLGDLRG
jgi:pimeloyl-ACP methyl ester carboxylesterase